MDNAEMPDMLLKYFDMTSPVHGDIYGDYEICPLEPDRPGIMRLVCISSASRLVVRLGCIRSWLLSGWLTRAGTTCS